MTLSNNKKYLDLLGHILTAHLCENPPRTQGDNTEFAPSTWAEYFRRGFADTRTAVRR